MRHSLSQSDVSIPFNVNGNADLTLQMVNGIRTAVANGFWKTGDLLPTAAAFQKALGTGGYVPRTALRRLADEGIIVLKKHVGAMVTGKGAHRWKGRVAFITTTARVSFYENAHAFALQEIFEAADWEFVHIAVRERFEDDKELDLAPLKRHIAHGIDIAICFTGSRQIAAELDKAKVKYVFEGGTGRDFPNAEAVINLEKNSQRAAEQLAQHWSAEKIRNALIVDFEHVMPRTVTSALFASGIRLRQITVKRQGPNDHLNSLQYLKSIQQSGLFAIEKFFSIRKNLGNPPDSIFFYDDYLAAGGLVALAATGLHVPTDIHVATISNRGFGPVWFKPLTRLEYDPIGNARLVGKYVLKLLAGENAVPPKLQLAFIEGKT